MWYANYTVQIKENYTNSAKWHRKFSIIFTHCTHTKKIKIHKINDDKVESEWIESVSILIFNVCLLGKINWVDRYRSQAFVSVFNSLLTQILYAKILIILASWINISCSCIQWEMCTLCEWNEYSDIHCWIKFSCSIKNVRFEFIL